jgi:hypothetical protein
MKAPIIFYSWQSDTKGGFNRRFLEACLLKVAEIAPPKLGLKNGIVIERDTTEVSGLVSIPQTIFGRIDRCAVFVGDITLVGQAWPKTEGDQPQKLPNANVMLELGYAAKAIGWKRIIGVMNCAYGKPDEQIFHFLQHRWPLQYTLKDKASVDAMADEVTDKLIEYIEAALREEHAEVARILERLNLECLQLLTFVKGVEYFSHDTLTQVQDLNLKKQLESIFPVAVNRLLDLGVIATHHDKNRGGYAYHWTYFGDLVRSRF